MKKIAIQGSRDYYERQEILEILRSYGGMNSKGYSCDSEGYYYINSNNIISLEHGIFPPEYELLTLKEYKEKYMSKENSKELKIEIPEGYEIDKEKSSFEKIIFKKVKKKLTYEQVANKLFENKNHYYTNEDGDVTEASIGWHCPNVAPTEHQLQRLLAINKLMNVAYYLNDGWKPNWDDDNTYKYYLCYDNKLETILINWNHVVQRAIVYFKSKELVEQAIEILGEETVKLALGIC